MAAFTNFLWTAAKNVATTATGVLGPGAAPTPANPEEEADAGSAGDGGEEEEEEQEEQEGGTC